MLTFVLTTLLLPCLVVAQCTSEHPPCPEGKICCTVDGQPSCCDDPQAILPMRANIQVQNATFGCDPFDCGGTCCTNGMFCCPLKFATCCSGFRCCDTLQTCCGAGCCPTLAKCCGSWCCKSGTRCGKSYMTCYNSASTFAPTLISLVLLLATVTFVTRI